MGVKNLVNFKLFAKKRAFFSKFMVFKHFWTPYPFPVAKFLNFLPKSASFFQKTWFLSIFGPHFRFLCQNFATFCHKAREALKNLKNQLISCFRFRFFWKNRQFFKVFAKKPRVFFKKTRFSSISGPYFRFLWQNSATFCQNTEVKPWKIWFSKENQLPFPVFSIFAIFGPQFHQLFATDIRCTKKNLRKKVTSGEKSTSVSCFSLG